MAVSLPFAKFHPGSSEGLKAGFDGALRTVREYHEKVKYIHLNPVKARLASRPEGWPWSNVHDYAGSLNQAVVTPSGLSVGRVLLPADQKTRI